MKKKLIPAPPGMTEEAVRNFNAAQLAAQAAGEEGKNAEEAFLEELRRRWESPKGDPES